MTFAEMVDASLERAERAMQTRTVEDLTLSRASLEGLLDLAAKREGCEQLVRDVLRTINDELAAQRSE